VIVLGVQTRVTSELIILTIGKGEVLMAKIIVVDPEKCGECHICEMICSLVKEGECNPAKSRISIIAGEMMETPLVCQQCEVLFCASVCQKNAIKRNETTNATVVDLELCNGCKVCIKACPFQAISYNAGRKKAFICDHCGGDPQCVKWCPTGALEYLDVTESSRQKQIAGGEKAFSLLKKIR
jgi:Fe-S-cluster-containing hydrogenase component 2